MGLADFVFAFSSIVILVLTGFVYGYEYGREDKEREMSGREEDNGNDKTAVNE